MNSIKESEEKKKSATDKQEIYSKLNSLFVRLSEKRCNAF
jgi:hypothetical protein